MGSRVGRQQKQKSLLLEEIADDAIKSPDMRKLARTHLAQANDAAMQIFDFIFRPAFRDRDALAGRHRQVIAVSHNADGDGASGDAVLHGMAALGAICSRDISKYVHFNFERVMRLSSDPNDPESVQKILARAEDLPTLCLFSDVGSSELEAITKHSGNAVVMDHHPLRTKAGRKVTVLNPYRQGLQGNQMSGGGETFLAFNYLIRRAMHNNPFRLKKAQRKRISILERSLLLTTLGGASADNIGCKGFNTLLYFYAYNLGLIYRNDIGGFGQSMKDIPQMIGQTMTFVNAKYPITRKKFFRRALSTSIKRGDSSLSPQEQELADRLYDTYRPYFMLQFNKPDQGHHSGLNQRRLFFNMQNIQRLETEQLIEINGLLKQLGVKVDPLERIVEYDERGPKDRVVVSPDSPIHSSEFYHYTDDFRGDMERRVKILTERFPIMIAELLNEMRYMEGQEPKIKSLQPTAKTKRKPIYERKPRAAELNPDELKVVKRICHELVNQYGDPIRKEEFHRAIEGPNYLIRTDREDIPEGYQGKTVAEVGNMLTAFSKLRQREAFLQALPWVGPPQKGAVANLSHIHSIYRRIIAVCSTRFEQLVEEITVPIGEGIYYVPLERVMKAKNEVAAWCKKEQDYDGAELVRKMPDTAMNGVILGVGLEAGLFPEIYAMVFGSLPITLEGKAGSKTSVRVHGFAGDKYKGHMGDILYRVTGRGGGHSTAASMRVWQDEQPEILQEITRRVKVSDIAERELQRRIPLDRRPISYGGS